MDATKAAGFEITESDEKPIKIKGKEFDFSKYLCETKITPLLRFYHEQDIKPIGWIKVKRKYIEWSYDKKSRCQLECSVRASKIKSYEINQIGKFVVASYDIECTSGDGSFPDPNKKTDKVIQIGTTINIFGEKKNYKYIATLKKCNPIEDCIVEEFKVTLPKRWTVKLACECGNEYTTEIPLPQPGCC